MNIRKANEHDLTPIVQIIHNSELGLQYFEKDILKLERVVKAGIENSEIHFLVVHEKQRGKGIGTELLRFFEDVLHKETRKLFLFVGKWNEAAHRLYERIGYCDCCEFEDFYKPGITEILMVKERKV